MVLGFPDYSIPVGDGRGFLDPGLSRRTIASQLHGSRVQRGGDYSYDLVDGIVHGAKRGNTTSVLKHPMIGGGESDTITFDAPEPGTYIFICSFPGHYQLMMGEFIVS